MRVINGRTNSIPRVVYREMNGEAESELESQERGLEFQDQELLPSILQGLSTMRKNRHFCDVVLQVESQEICAHRSVLAAVSPFLFELFSADDNTKTTSENLIVYKLNSGISKDAFETLVNYAYTGSLVVPSALVKSVYAAACKLKIEKVAAVCAEHLVKNLDDKSCISVRAIRGIASNTDSNFIKQIDDYISEKFSDIVSNKEVLGLPCLQVEVLHSSREEMTSIIVDTLGRLVLDWMKKMVIEEEFTLSMFTEKMHLLYLSMDNALHDCKEIPKGNHIDSEIIQDYKKMSKRHSKPQGRRKISLPVPSKPRVLLYSRDLGEKMERDQEYDWKLIAYTRVRENGVTALVTMDGTLCTLSVVQRLNKPSPYQTPLSSRPPSIEKVDSYTLLPTMKSAKCAVGSGNLAGKLIVCGGYDREECLRTVELYDPSSNLWSELAPMKQARGRFDITVVGSLAFAVGGCDGSSELSSVEMYDPKTERWSFVAPLPLARSNTGVCQLEGRVFCIGGWNGQFGIRHCDMYDPKTNVWSTIAQLNIGRYQAGVTSLNGHVVAVGGCDSWHCLNSVEKYSPEYDTWIFITQMSSPRRGCGVSVYNGKLYVMGGSDGTHSLCSTEIYDPDTDTWNPGPNMTSCRANVNTVVVDGKLYAVGGFSGKTFLNSIEVLDPVRHEWTTFVPKPGLSTQHSVNKSVSSEDDCNSDACSNREPGTTPSAKMEKTAV